MDFKDAMSVSFDQTCLHFPFQKHVSSESEYRNYEKHPAIIIHIG